MDTAEVDEEGKETYDVVDISSSNKFHQQAELIAKQAEERRMSD